MKRKTKSEASEEVKNTLQESFDDNLAAHQLCLISLATTYNKWAEKLPGNSRMDVIVDHLGINKFGLTIKFAGSVDEISEFTPYDEYLILHDQMVCLVDEVKWKVEEEERKAELFASAKSKITPQEFETLKEMFLSYGA